MPAYLKSGIKIAYFSVNPYFFLFASQANVNQMISHDRHADTDSLTFNVAD